MNLIDILTKLTESDPDPDQDKEDEIIGKIKAGIAKRLSKLNEDVIAQVFFHPNWHAAHDEFTEGILKSLDDEFDVGLMEGKIDQDALIRLFKDIGLSRGDALFLLDRR